MFFLMEGLQLFNQLVLTFYLNVLNIIKNVIIDNFKDIILQFYFLWGESLRNAIVGSQSVAELPSPKRRAISIPTRRVLCCALPGLMDIQNASRMTAGTCNALLPFYQLPWSFCTKKCQYF